MGRFITGIWHCRRIDIALDNYRSSLSFLGHLATRHKYRTTIITFLMVFLIQKTQNKDSKAIQLKLNELLAASNDASNRMVDVEDIDETEMDILHKFYQQISDKAETDQGIHRSHSIDAANDLHQQKQKTDRR